MADECELSTYDELVEVITNLRFLVREKRRRERLSYRAAAEAVGLSGKSGSTLHRFEGGQDVSAENLVALIRWVGAAARPVRDGGEPT